MIKKVIPFLLILGVLLGCASCNNSSSNAANSTASTKTTSIADRLDRIFSSDNTFSGSVLIAQSGKVLLDKGYGMADIENHVANTSTTMFPIGSNTKQFTAIAVMQLYSKGKLDIDDKLSKYLPDFPRGDEITLRNLLTHTSGITNYTSINKSVDEFPPLDQISEDFIINLLKTKPLDFDPGTKYVYSNSNYLILGYIIEKVSGLSYGQYMSKNIFDPLGMKNTGLIYDNGKQMFNTVGYSSYPDGKAVTNDPSAIYLVKAAYGAGGLYSTVEDMYLWDQALSTEKLLPKKYMDMIFTPYKTNKLTTDYGFGWEIQNDPNYGKLEWHGGAIVGFTSINYRYVDKDVAVVVLTNLDQVLTQSNVAAHISNLDYNAMQAIFNPSAASGTIANKLDLVFANDKGFNGCVLIAKNGITLLDKGYGMADEENNTAMSSTTKVPLAGLAFQFTAAAVMQLYEKGLIDPSDKLSKYIPDFPKGDQITIANLLTGSSGISDYFNDFPEIIALPLDNITPENIINILKKKPLAAIPGTQNASKHSDYGAVLPYIIEKISGISYSDYLQKNIFDPLGMKNTGPLYGNSGQVTIAVGYNGNTNFETSFDKDGNTNIAGVIVSKDKLFKSTLSFYSTVEDMYLWDQAITSEELLPKKYIDMMFAPNLKINATSSEGYGILITNDSTIGTMYSGGGAYNGYVTASLILPDKKISVMILMNDYPYTNINSVMYEVVKILS